MKDRESFAAIRPPNQRGIEAMSREDAEILAGFTEPEQKEIVRKQKLLSALGLFIGKDFDMPVLLNKPGAGWHWNFKDNHIKIDPKDLLEKPIEYLRFVICHEGGHRRISRTDFIPEEVWKQPGFSYMMNAIEDPRDNNFVSDAYPTFKEQMTLAYSMEQEFEAEAKKVSKDKTGSVPRFVLAGHEYIKQWFKEVQEQPFEIDSSLPKEVQDVVRTTLPAAQDSWWRYPSKEEADESEELISKYAQASYRINLEKVWPDYKKLVDEDLKDEKTRQAMEDMAGGEGEEGVGIPKDLKDGLTPGEQKELGEIIQAAKDGKGTPQPIDGSKLSPELRKKLEAYVESLPEDKKKELAARAQKMLAEIEEAVNKALEGKLVEHGPSEQPLSPKTGEITPDMTPIPATDVEDAEQVREKLKELLEENKSEYNRVRQEVLPIIDRLEDDLREIFVERRARKWEPGHKFGKRINLKRRIQEKAKGVSAVESRAWEKREAPQEKDYAFSLLVDLSGSMRGGKIQETFKAVVVLCEVLNRLSIKTEILGFNDHLYEFQNFNAALSEDIRESMGSMLSEVSSPHARYNDDGWALKQASVRLAREDAAVKFLIPLSDGRPAESPEHGTADLRLENVVRQITAETDQKLIALGIGPDTEHVETYYPNNLANVPLAEMAEKLADLIREAIENYQDF